MTITADALTSIAPPPEPRRDRWGRYLITPAAGGTPVAHTRATTWAKALDDQEGLINWSMRMTAVGLARRHDLYAQAASCREDDTAALRRIADEAKEAGGATHKANIGTALHRFAERVDLGETVTIPDPHRADIDAYQTALTAHKLTVIPALIERIAVVPEFTVAGTFDRIYQTADGLVVGDIKTGSLDYAALSISVQLALYAHGHTLYDPGDDTHHAMPPVRQDIALVVHIPAGAGTCTIHTVDIEAGWRYAALSGQVRAARNAGKRRGGLIAPYQPQAETGSSPQTLPPSTTVDVETLRGNAVERLAAIKNHPTARADMARLWPADVPPFKGDHRHDATQLRAILDTCARVEALHELPFIVDPDHNATAAARRDKTIAAAAETTATRRTRGHTPDEGAELSPQQVADVRSAVASATVEQRQLLTQWIAEGLTARHPWSMRAAQTERRYAIYHAALAVSSYADDDIYQAAAKAVTPATPAAPVGAWLGTLTTSEADQIAALCAALSTGEAALHYEDGTPTIKPAKNTKGQQ